MTCNAPTRKPPSVTDKGGQLRDDEAGLPPTRVGGLFTRWTLEAGGAAHFSARTALFASITLALLASCLMSQVSSPPGFAQSTPTVTDRGVRNEFPQRMIFSISANSDSPIEKIRLRYKILPDGTAASGLPDF